jgi:hypothetical protein
MTQHRSCGHHGWLVQYMNPVWEPLLVAVGQRLAETFMWMHEEELDDGSVLQAYKHIHTERDRLSGAPVDPALPSPVFSGGWSAAAGVAYGPVASPSRLRGWHRSWPDAQRPRERSRSTMTC